MRYRFGVLMAALWWGSLTGLGFVVVPMLFTYMPSPAAAGAMAAKLFTAQAWLSIGCAMLLLLVFNPKQALGHDVRTQAAIKFIVTAFLLAVGVEFGLSPRIVSARVDGGNLKLLHGLGSAMYFGQWVCSGVVLWVLSSSTSVFNAHAQAHAQTAKSDAEQEK